MRIGEMQGPARADEIAKSCVSVQFQILGRQRNALTMAQEAERIREGA